MIASLRLRALTSKGVLAALVLGLLSAIAPVVAPHTSGLLPQSHAATTVSLTDADALVFNRANGTVNIVGDGKSAGNIVLYKNVGNFGGVAIDAAVTTEALSGSISDYDNPGSASTATGAANNFQLNTVGGQVSMKFEFFQAGTYTAAGTGIPVILQNVKITSIDLDSSSSAGSYQYSDFTGFQKYSMMSPTNLAVSTGVVNGTAGVRFIAAKTGSRSSVPEDQVLVKYDAVQTFRVNFGNVIAGSTNYFGLVFGGWPNGGTPVEYTNLFNAPPVSTNYTTTMSTTAESNTVTTAMFGAYSDPDLNPFTKVQLGAASSGNMQYFNGTSWANISAGTYVTIADIEAGKVRFDPSGASSPVTVAFYVNDGLLNSVSSYTLTINLVANTNQIIFNNPGNQSGPSGSAASGATATSGLTVTLMSNTPSVCTVSGLTINWSANGTCSITATEPGNVSYPAALPVTQTFLIYQATSNTQSINFAQPTGKNTGVTFASGATATSTLPVTLTSNTPSICIVSGLNIITLAAGTCSITATQPGGTVGGQVYPPAAPVTQTFLVPLTSQHQAAGEAVVQAQPLRVK